MIERKLHFNEYGILTAKLTVKTDEEELVCREFVNVHKNAVFSYFENEYSTNADLKYKNAFGKRKHFRPYHLTVFYSCDTKGKKCIKADISSKTESGEKAVITGIYSVFSCFGGEFFRGAVKRKSFSKTT